MPQFWTSRRTRACRLFQRCPRVQVSTRRMRNALSSEPVRRWLYSVDTTLRVTECSLHSLIVILLPCITMYSKTILT